MKWKPLVELVNTLLLSTEWKWKLLSACEACGYNNIISIYIYVCGITR